MNYTQLQDECLNYGFAPGYRPRFQNWLNEAMHAIARRVFIREMVTTADTVVAAGTGTIALPTDFVRLQDVINRSDASLQPLAPISQERYDGLVPQAGPPVYYTLDAAGVLLFPTPSSTITIRVRYYRDFADALSTDTPPLPAAHHDVLVSYAVSRGYRSEDDQERANAFMADFERGVAELAADRRGEIQDGPKQVAGMWGEIHPGNAGYR